MNGPPTTPQYEAHRSVWVKEEAARTARAHQSYIANGLSSNTVKAMADKDNLALADADGGGTIDKAEFATLLAAAGGDAKNLQEMQAIFAAADKDGDGELTEEEIKMLDQFKKEQREK